MRELLVLKSGGEDMCRRYGEMFASGKFPSDFAQKRLEMSNHHFGKIKDIFLDTWPNWNKNIRVHESIERAVIFRNGFAHANIQFFRNYLLYAPSQKAWNSINEYVLCPKCLRYYKDCECPQESIAEPHSLIFRCLDKEFLRIFYEDIKTIDIECFAPTAEELDIPYQGVEWP